MLGEPKRGDHLRVVFISYSIEWKPMPKHFKIFLQKEIKIFCSFAAINVGKTRGNPKTALRVRKTLDFKRL